MFQFYFVHIKHDLQFPVVQLQTELSDPHSSIVPHEELIPRREQCVLSLTEICQGPLPGPIPDTGSKGTDPRLNLVSNEYF